MERRAFLAGAAALLAAPLAAEAQQAGKVPRIGFSSASSLRPRDRAIVEAFRQGLARAGLDRRPEHRDRVPWAEERTERLPDLAAELVSLKVDVIVAATTPSRPAAKQATTTIPIVMAVAADPVATGFVVSLARPGRQYHGAVHDGAEILAGNSWSC